MTNNAVYARVADCLLCLKAEGATKEQLSLAIVKAASEAGLRPSDIEAAQTANSDWWQP